MSSHGPSSRVWHSSPLFQSVSHTQWGLLRVEPSVPPSCGPVAGTEPTARALSQALVPLKLRCFPAPTPVRAAPFSRGSHLLTDEAEASVRPLTLVGLPQDGVEGLAACSVVRGGVGRDGKGGDVHLQGEGRGERHWVVGWEQGLGPGVELRQQEDSEDSEDSEDRVSGRQGLAGWGRGSLAGPGAGGVGTMRSQGSAMRLAWSRRLLYSSSSQSRCRVLSGSLSCTGIDTLDRSLPMLLRRMFHRLTSTPGPLAAGRQRRRGGPRALPGTHTPGAHPSHVTRWHPDTAGPQPSPQPGPQPTASHPKSQPGLTRGAGRLGI